jgi:hypothetical protein
MEEDFGFELEHLLWKERKCRVCGVTKNLLEDFYMIRKHKKSLPSAYSYECKECTIKRVIESRKNKPDIPYDPVPRFGPEIYPDW